MTDILPVKNGNGALVNLAVVSDNSDNVIPLHQISTGTEGQAAKPVDLSNPLPVVQTPTAVTPTGGDAHEVVTAGTPVTAFDANSIPHGAYILNPASNTVSIFVNDTGAAPQTTSPPTDGTTEEIPPGWKWEAVGPLTTPVQVDSTQDAVFFAAKRY